MKETTQFKMIAWYYLLIDMAIGSATLSFKVTNGYYHCRQRLTWDVEDRRCTRELWNFTSRSSCFIAPKLPLGHTSRKSSEVVDGVFSFPAALSSPLTSPEIRNPEVGNKSTSPVSIQHYGGEPQEYYRQA